MANQIIKVKLVKKCPRCGSDECLVSAFHLSTTWKAMCAVCGLSDGKSGDDKETVMAVQVNCYYNYEQNLRTK